MNTAHLTAVPNAPSDIPLQEASLDIWQTKYRLKSKVGEPIDQNIDDTYHRVARALAEIEETPELQARWEKEFLWALRHGAIPAGRITSNAGAREHKPAQHRIRASRVRKYPTSRQGRRAPPFFRCWRIHWMSSLQAITLWRLRSLATMPAW